MSDEERSFDPTPHRRQEFRRQGRFARSRDAGGVLATAAVVGVLVGSRAAIAQAMQVLFLRCHGDLSALERQSGDEVLRACSEALLIAAVPAVLAAAAAALAAGLVQAGLLVNLDALSFQLDRLNPMPQLGRMFSPKAGATQVLLSLLRVGVVGYVGYRALVIEVPGLLALGRVGIESGGMRLMDAATRVVGSALAALGGVALVDYAQSRFSLEQEMKMTRKEIMDETRSQDGDPKWKARMRARAHALARRRAMSNVKTASVVVANPTHISVALRYSSTDAAPVVVAKGHDDVALQIRTEARKHNIPILENRPLARALDAEVPLGQPIPAVHFVAVARILAFVSRLRGAPARRVRRSAA